MSVLQNIGINRLCCERYFIVEYSTLTVGLVMGASGLDRYQRIIVVWVPQSLRKVLL